MPQNKVARMPRLNKKDLNLLDAYRGEKDVEEDPFSERSAVQSQARNIPPSRAPSEIDPVKIAAAKRRARIHPQKRMDRFWTKFEPVYLGKLTKVLPENLISRQPTPRLSHDSKNAVMSYEQARETCIKSVKRIIRECRSLNQRYTDDHFDLERDLKVTWDRKCLDGLSTAEEDKEQPADVKRVTDIFENPSFYVDGPGHDDIIQGRAGDCWFLSSLMALTCNQEFLDRVCVIRDQKVGVYGFVFHRDGEWIPCIIDDKLYMKAPEFSESAEIVLGHYGMAMPDEEKKYRELFQRGAQSLYFARCRDPNETWVSLIEKAYAKAHGDFDAISGGKTGEGIEDLTGGVTTEMFTTNILDKDEFWDDQLTRIGKDFVFSCAMAMWQEWRSWMADAELKEQRRGGVVSGHAYAVLDIYKGHGQRLVKIRNPWGTKEWQGAWSDGSKEWTPEWLNRIGHKFGDDGIFWMSYEDFLSKFRYIDRTRIFGPEWTIAQEWASLQVPFSMLDYQATKFSITVQKAGPVVIVLSQLDTRYFKGLEGGYNFTLQFRVQKDSDDDDDYIVRSRKNYQLRRSVNAEIELAKGTYTVLIKIEASESDRLDVEEVIRRNIHWKDKITQIGAQYDLAHRKGIIEPEPEPKAKPAPAPEPVVQEKSAPEPKTNGVVSVEPLEEEPETPVSTTNAEEKKLESSEPVSGPTVEPATPATTTAVNGSVTPKPTGVPKIMAPPSVRACSPPPPQPQSPVRDAPPDAEDDDDFDIDEPTPWNAVCVVGLRVFSQDPDLTVKVILPPKKDQDNRDTIAPPGPPPTLDRDDPAKGGLERVISKDKKTDEENAKDDGKEEKKEEEKREEENIEQENKLNIKQRRDAESTNTNDDDDDNERGESEQESQ